MKYKEQLLDNIDKIHTTSLGIIRIKRNLKLEENNIVEHLISKIKDENCIVKRVGKNYYASIFNYMITINASSYTIITAHIIKK